MTSPDSRVARENPVERLWVPDDRSKDSPQKARRTRRFGESAVFVSFATLRSRGLARRSKPGPGAEGE
jgi:hypothetical protein